MGTVLHGLAIASAAALVACGAVGTDHASTNDVSARHGQTSPPAGGRNGSSSGAGDGARSIPEALASDTGLAIESDGVTTRLKAPSCEGFAEGLSICHGDVQLHVSIAGEQLDQTLHPGSIIVRTDALIHHGPLRPPVPEAHTLVFSDVNADGHEDLMVWSGRDGAYGGPSFDVYLLDTGQRRFVRSEPFSELTIGNIGLFSVEDGLVRTNSGDGCCLHVQESYAIEANVPKLIERITTEDAVGGGQEVTRERLIDGELTVVDKE